MSVLAVGLSHKSAPVATLERAVLTGDGVAKLLRDAYQGDEVAGAILVSTCNRVEVYAEVGTFHGGVAAICELLVRHSGMPLTELTPHLYVHYEDRAVQHLLAVACGLDSMVVGESQILGQVRESLRLAREQGTLSRGLADLGRLALHAGKRAHAETGIGRAGASLVSVGLTAAAEQLGAAGGPAGPLDGRSVLVVGAGSMSSLAVSAAAAAGAARIGVANRTPQHARLLADTVSGTSADLTALPGLIADADLVISCTGSAGHVIGAGIVGSALSLREPAGRPLVFLDLALPRDVDAVVAQLPGVAVIDLESMSEPGPDGGALRQDAVVSADVAAVRRIVADEFAAHVAAHRAARVAPTVVALRAKAAGVVDAELSRLAARLGGLEPGALDEVARSMRRITDKLLHAPTVRVKELAGSPGAESYEDALRVLFDLDPEAVQAVTRADAELAGWPDQEAAP